MKFSFNLETAKIDFSTGDSLQELQYELNLQMLHFLMLDNIREAKINLIYKEENFLSCCSYSVVVLLLNLKSSLFLKHWPIYCNLLLWRIPPEVSTEDFISFVN